MKLFTLLVLTTLSQFSTLSFAQVTETKTEKETTSIGANTQKEKKTIHSSSLVKASEAMANEEEVLQKALNDIKPGDKLGSCKEAEIARFKKSSSFLVNHKKDIDKVAGVIQGAQNAQRAKLLDYSKGYLDENATEKTILKAVRVKTETGFENKDIPLQDLISFVRAYMDDMSKIPENDINAIAAVKSKYNKKENGTDPAFFNLTLEQATAGYVELNNEHFSLSNQQQVSGNLFLGNDQHLFRVNIALTLGWFEGMQIGSQLAPGKPNVTTVISKDFTEIFNPQARTLQSEQPAYDAIRKNELTIKVENEWIPMDALLRIDYFEKQADPACQKRRQVKYNTNSVPGPYISFLDKSDCTNVGMLILSASMSRSLTGSYHPFTDDLLKEVPEGVRSFSFGTSWLQNTAHKILGSGSCDHIYISVTYVCDCDPEQVKPADFKLGGTAIFSCPKL